MHTRRTLRPAVLSILRLTLLAVAGLGSLAARDFHVTPGGTRLGDGSTEHPWDLTTALAQPRFVQPGDVIWLHGGTYEGSFVSELRGTRELPIIVRGQPGERVTIDGAASRQAALTINGENAWFWGFEVTNSSPAPRVTDRSDFDLRPYAVTVMGPYVRLINLIVHDAGSGVGLWSSALDTEMYGCIVYYNGWTDPNRGHGEGVYMQNTAGTKRLIDNVLFNQFDHGIMAYGSSKADVNNVYYEGNVVFSNGKLTRDPNGWGILIGGGRVALNHTLVSNYAYNRFDYRRSNNLDIAYGKGSENVILRDNYSAGLAAINYDRAAVNLAASGNTFIGAASTSAVLQISGLTNRFLQGPRATTDVFLRPNRYEQEKTLVIVYNWSRSNEIKVDVGEVLQPGDYYEIRKVENYFAPPLRTGKNVSGRVAFPMDDTIVAAPVGTVPNYPASTFPEFGVFELRKIPTPNPEPEEAASVKTTQGIRRKK